jgi:hypothetical protein
MFTPVSWLNLGSAASAFGAAYFWFRSALGAVPPMVPYFDKAPPDDPFIRALEAAAANNRFAAGLAGVSAVLMAAATVLEQWQRR